MRTHNVFKWEIRNGSTIFHLSIPQSRILHVALYGWEIFPLTYPKMSSNSCSPSSLDTSVCALEQSKTVLCVLLSLKMFRLLLKRFTTYTATHYKKAVKEEFD